MTAPAAPESDAPPEGLPPPPPSPTSAPPKPALSLEYATLRTRERTMVELHDLHRNRRRLVGALRQLTLAVGAAVFALNLGRTLLHQDADAPIMMGMGAFVFVLALPLRRGDRFW